MPQKYTNREDIEILFDGSKNFWRQKINPSIIFALHLNSKCVELIISNNGLEAPRLYVDWTALKTKIDGTNFKEKLANKKEILIRQHKPIVENIVTKQLYNEMMNQYLISRLNVLGNWNEKEFLIELMVNIGDIINESTKKLDIQRSLPINLLQLEVFHEKTATLFLVFI
jgi:hypothetical protein